MQTQACGSHKFPVDSNLVAAPAAVNVNREPKFMLFYASCAALGFFMLAASFVMLLAINVVQGWGQRRLGLGAVR